jgi:hypothetical protein
MIAIISFSIAGLCIVIAIVWNIVTNIRDKKKYEHLYERDDKEISGAVRRYRKKHPL